MALVKSIISSSKFCFSITTTDSGNDSKNTRKVIVSEVPWKIVFCHEKNSDVLNVHLACDYDDNTDEWWIEAECNLKILSTKDDTTPIEVKLEPAKFMNSRRMSKCYSIKYEDLVSGYVQNNMFAVECAIMAGPLIREPSSLSVRLTSHQFIMKIENVDELGEAISSKYNLRGINWFVKFVKIDEKLGVFLWKEKVNQDFSLTVEANFKVKLLSFSKEVNPIVESLQHKFSSDAESGWGWSGFVNWETFTDEDKLYVQSNTAFFHITVEIGPWKPVYERENVLQENKSLTSCPICLEQLNGHIVATRCGHLFCSECITTSIERNIACPVCNTIVMKDEIRKIFL